MAAPAPWEMDWSQKKDDNRPPWERNYGAPPPPEKPPTAPTTIRDIGVAGASGFVGATKALTDVFGADNAASKALESASTSLAGMYTPERQREMQYYQAQQQEAAKRGDTTGEVGAAFEGIKAAPLQGVVQAIGSLIPNLATLFIPGAGEARALQLSRGAINTAIGIMQGTGAVKGSIYEGVKQELIKNGADEATAERMASQAQSYLGPNADQILAGAVIGYGAGKFGAEELLAPKVGGVTRKLAAVGTETVTESTQGGQEQVAQNIALQRQGFDVPTFQGVAGAATQEGIMGALGAGPVAMISGRPSQKDVPDAQPVTENQILPDGSVAMTREDLAKYEEEQFRKKYAPQDIGTPSPPAGPPPMPTESGLTYATATQEIELLKRQGRTPETEARIKELQQYKMETLTDQINAARLPVSPELKAIREQMERGDMTYEGQQRAIDQMLAEFYSSPRGFKGLEKQGPVKSEDQQELDELIREARKLSSEYKKASAPSLNNELRKDLKGKLFPDEVVSEIGAEKQFKYLAATKGVRGKLIADLVGDGALDKYLPPDMRHDSGTFDNQVSEEYIKDLLRSGQYRPYDAQFQSRILGDQLSELDTRIKELTEGPQKLAELSKEETQEEADRIARDAGYLGQPSPEEVLQPIEEFADEQATDQYYPDQSEISGRLSQQEIREPEFQEWFGESKMINEAGEPMVLYHGTNADIDKFRVSKEGGSLGNGIYLTPISEFAGEYAKQNGGNVMPLYASIKNPLIIDGSVSRDPMVEALVKLGVDRDKAENIVEKAYDQKGYITNEVKSRATAQGYDGITQYRDGKLTEIVAFNPAQVKSVFNKRPTNKKGILEERKPFVINKDPEHERIEKELTGKTMRQVAQWAVDNAPNQFAKVIAQKVANRINGMLSRGIKMEFEVVSGERRPLKMGNARGLVEYDFGKPGEGKNPTFKMTLNGAAVIDNQNGYPPGTRYITVLHELLHVATVGQINVLKGTDPLVKDLRDLFNQVVTHFNTEVRAGRMTPFMEKMYKQEINALSSPDELLAWGIADQEMQGFLSEIKVGDKTVMDKLVELIRKILNITKDYMTALDQLVKTTESILDEDVDVVGDKIAAKQYSFGVKPGIGEAVQGTLFEKAGIAAKAKEAAGKAARKLSTKRPEMEREAFEDVDEGLVNRLKDVFFPENKTIVDRIDGMRDNFWKKLAQGVADQYRTIKDYTEEGYMLARMSKTIDGALEGLLFNGQVALTDGALDIKQNTKGLVQVMEPVGKEVDRFQIWMALNRDAQLVRQGKIPSVDPKLVERASELANGKIGGKSRLEVYEQVRKDLNALNRSVLNIARKQGLIDEDAYQIFANDINYIPFYKAMEDGDIQGAATASGLARQEFSKQLKGGEKPFADLMENTLRNWSHILSASMKNKAANVTIDAAMDMGAAYPNLKVGFEWRDGKVYSVKSGEMVGDGSLKAEYTTQKAGMVKTMINGKPAYFEVVDPLLLDSISSIGYMGPKSKFLDVAKDFKNLLQFGVTLSPAFKVRNLFRDSISAMAVSDLKLSPIANVVKGWNASSNENPAHISALAGGAIFNFGSYYEGDQSRLIKRLLKQGVNPDSILDTDEKIKKGITAAWRKYQEWGNKSESANRMALYQQMRDRGMSHLEASFYARDLLDFSMQGSWPAFRLVAQVVPFLNARVQGLYKLGRDGVMPTSRVIYNTVTGKPIELTDKQKAQQFGTVTSAVVLASMALYLMFKDDDEFQKREAWDRDNFWWFKLPGMDAALRVPKPFEIGAFGTMAERVLEQIVDQGAEGKQFEESFRRMLGDTFALNPVPQMFKPLLDLYANKDSFTGAPIETAGMERLSKQERASDTTSPLAKALGGISSVVATVAGEKTELSPVQIDYAIKAYLGWLGGTISFSSHYAVMPFSKSAYPDHNWADTMSLGFVKSLPQTQSRYVTEFYQNSKQISQAYADMRHYAELGQADKVNEILADKGNEIALAKAYDKSAKDMSKIRQAITQIRNDETMSGAQKKEEIDRLKLIIDEIAKQMETVRKDLK